MRQSLQMKKLLQHKQDLIRITIGTISKLRKVQLFVEPEVNDMLYNDIKHVLYLAMNRDDNYKHCEVVKVVDYNTNESVIVYGDRWHVPTSQNKEYLNFVSKSSYATLVSIHNHPNGGTFSAADIRVLLTTPSINILIAVGNDGTIYTLTKSIADKDKVLDYITNEAAKLPKQCDDEFWDNKSREDIIAARICNNYKQFGLYYTKTTRRKE